MGAGLNNYIADHKQDWRHVLKGRDAALQQRHELRQRQRLRVNNDIAHSSATRTKEGECGIQTKIGGVLTRTEVERGQWNNPSHGDAPVRNSRNLEGRLMWTCLVLKVNICISDVALFLELFREHWDTKSSPEIHRTRAIGFCHGVRGQASWSKSPRSTSTRIEGGDSGYIRYPQRRFFVCVYCFVLYGTEVPWTVISVLYYACVWNATALDACLCFCFYAECMGDMCKVSCSDATVQRLCDPFLESFVRYIICTLCCSLVVTPLSFKARMGHLAFCRLRMCQT